MEKRDQMQIDTAQENSSKKRKRQELKGPAGYGIPDQQKKRKIDENDAGLSAQDQNVPAKSNYQQQQEIEKILLKHETKYQDLLAGNKAFFSEFKNEGFQRQIEKDIQHQSFGNHDKFYNLPKGASFSHVNKWHDLRLDKFQDEWLRNKTILDVGCGTGVVDLLVAVKFQPKLVIGIDIDHRQIKKAITNMQKAINDQEQLNVIVEQAVKHRDALQNNEVDMIEQYEKQQKRQAQEKEQKYKELLLKIKNLPISLQITLEGKLAHAQNESQLMIVNALTKENYEPNPKEAKNYLYGKVCFRTENYIENTVISQKEKFDVVMCLSTVKYIHLTFGDIGIKTLFLKAYDQLNQNGLFILENQLWKSYKKNKNESDRSKKNFNEIEIRPHFFRQYLEKIGFEMIESLMPSEAEAKEGFDRPIMVFKKV
eukprot:403377432